jgi:transcription elongation factor
VSDTTRDPANDPDYEQLGDQGNTFTEHKPDALVEDGRVAIAEDMESASKATSASSGSGAAGSATGSGDYTPGYEGEAPNAPLASQGQRDSTHQNDDERGFDPDKE